MGCTHTEEAKQARYHVRGPGDDEQGHSQDHDHKHGGCTAEVGKRYESELVKAVRALKTLPEVDAQLQLKLSQGGESADLAGPLLLYWLDSACKTCYGTGVQMPAARACGKCREHPGLAKVPGGDVGRAVLEHVNECASWASKEVRDACKH